MKVFVINGSGGVGKDTFVNLCIKHSKKKIHNISTIDKVKSAAEILGWDGKKDERGRKLLSNLKDLACEYSDFSVNIIKSYIKNNSDIDVLFVHAREPEDIERIFEAFDAQSILVTNIRVEEISSNHADAEVEKYFYDYTIRNDTTLIDLTREAVRFLTDQDLL